MTHPAGESNDGSLRVDLDRRLRLQFRGSALTPAGAVRYCALGAKQGDAR